jgi:hypothetical protein
MPSYDRGGYGSYFYGDMRHSHDRERPSSVRNNPDEEHELYMFKMNALLVFILVWSVVLGIGVLIAHLFF